MSSLPKHHVTLEEYFELDAKAEVKSEYYAGEMFAMAGGTPNHARLAFNLAGELRPALAASGCSGFSSDLRVKAGDLLTYPDLTVVCGEPHIGFGDTLENPTVIFEVLSPSTEGYDRGHKFAAYRSIESLRSYVMIEQDRQRVEVFTRSGSLWEISEFKGPDAVLYVPALEARIPLSGLYQGIVQA